MDYRALLIVPLAALVLSVSAAAPRVPDHWQTFSIAHTDGPVGAPYEIGVTPGSDATGTPTVIIRSTHAQRPTPASVGALSQPALGYAGQRVRFRAEVRAEGPTPWAGAFIAPADGGQVLRVARGEPDVERQLPAGAAVAADGRWQPVSVVFDVPAGMPTISVGLALVGEGQLWAQHLAFEVVGDDVPVTPTPIGIDWAQARETMAQNRRLTAQLPPQALVNAQLD